MKLLLVGTTGLVGRHVLEIALADTRFEQVIALTRRPIGGHARLRNVVVDFDALPAQATCWDVDGVICTLGTTIGKAGSREAFRKVDHDYVLAVARLARGHGASVFAYNSALGADPSSRVFYNRIKGEVEADLVALGYPSLTFVRPGLIGGERDEFRLGEHIASILLRACAPLLPRRYRINPAPNIARALIEAVADARPGCHVIASASLA